MNELVRVGELPTMSSIEIATLCQKQHPHVLRDIRSLFEVLREDDPKVDDRAKHTSDARGYTKEVFLQKRETLILVSGYNVAMRARIIDRWQELEARDAAPKVPTTYAEALRLAADQAEALIEQAKQLEAQKPAVEFVERYVAAEGNKGIRQVAQLLNVRSERDFVQWLIDRGIMYRLEGALTPMAAQRHTGRFVIKAGVSRTSEHAYNAAKFTPKGVEWVAGEWAKHQLHSMH